MSALEYEMEALPELLGEGELESEWELEGEAEAEEFFGRLAGLARGAAASPALRRIGLAAARGALSGLGGVGSAIGGATGAGGAATVGRDLGNLLGRQVSSWLPQSELEGEWEVHEEEVNPIRRVYPDALMEHIGHEAAQAESEEEAEAFIGALVPLAARLIPRVAPTIMRVAPQLIRGAAGAARALRANPATRQLVRALPTVVRRTTASLARQVQGGRPVTPQAAVQTLARQTAKVLANPRACVNAYRRSRALDRTFHRAAGPGTTGTGPVPGPAAAAARGRTTAGVPRPPARPPGCICGAAQAGPRVAAPRC
jgi:hypothetical protein